MITIAASGESLNTFPTEVGMSVSRAPSVPPAMFSESPTTSAMIARASLTD